MGKDLSLLVQSAAPRHRPLAKTPAGLTNGEQDRAKSAGESSGERDVSQADRVTLSGAARMTLREGSTPGQALESTAGSQRQDAVFAYRPSPALANMKAAFFTTSDSKEFDASSDLNGDGVINFLDLAALRDKQSGQHGTVPVVPESTVDTIAASFLSSAGSDEFNAAADLNGDGVVNFLDLAALREQEAGAGTTPPGEPDSLLSNIAASFLSSEGSAGFDALADLNDDGTVNFHDLAAYREVQNSFSSVHTSGRKAQFEALTASFLSSQGQSNFSALADLDGNGAINFKDLAALRSILDIE